MRRIIISVLMITGMLLPAQSRADDGMVTLKDLEQEALLNNPEINMAAKKAESADEKKSLAAAMPDPMIGYMVQNVGSPFAWSVGKEDMSMQGVVFSQEIPFPGKLSTMGHAAGKMAEREQENAREIRLRVLAELRNAYYDYYLAYRSTEILSQTRDLMKNVQQIAETRYGTGQGMQQDVLRAQLEVLMLLDKLAEEERKKETQAAMINGLIGRNPLATLGRPAEPPRSSLVKSAEELAAMAEAHSPLLLGKQRMVEQSAFEVSSRKKDYLPDMVLSGGWYMRGEKQDVWAGEPHVQGPALLLEQIHRGECSECGTALVPIRLRCGEARGPGPRAGPHCHGQDLRTPSAPLQYWHHTTGGPGPSVRNIELPRGKDRFPVPARQPEPVAQVPADGAGGIGESKQDPFDDRCNDRGGT